MSDYSTRDIDSSDGKVEPNSSATRISHSTDGGTNPNITTTTIRLFHHVSRIIRNNIDADRKTGVHPMRVHLKLFFKWGIEFDKDNPYCVTEHGNRKVEYAEKQEIQDGIDIVTVSKMLGHARVSTTEDIYSHVIEASKELDRTI